MIIYSTHKKAFTLIELLVVIAIIGILSSVVLASLSGARESARIAAAQQFESSTYNILGNCLEAEYRFEGSGSTVDETSGWSGRDGTIEGDPQRVDGLDNEGQAMEFDGSGDAVVVGDLDIGTLDEWTVSFWAKPSASQSSSWAGTVSNGDAGNTGEWSINVRDNNWAVTHSGDYSFGSGLPISYSIDSGEYQHIALSYDGDEMNLYKNGGLVDSSSGSQTYNAKTSDFFFGKYIWSGNHRYYTGTLDNVRLFSCAIK